MTEEMNFFQSIFMFKKSAPASLSREEARLVVSLKREAQNLAAIAEEEMRNGRMARGLAFDAADKEKMRIFAGIAIWHNSRAAEKYRKSAERFEEAGKIQITNRKACYSMAKKMKRRAAESAAAVDALNVFAERDLTEEK
jgi:hypothetical protein